MPAKNSLDLLRLLAAVLVLYSHQYVLLGYKEPMVFGWNTVGGLGVSIFFFLSGFLVWTSWARDPDAWRFFLRRGLRIFPGLWLAILLTVLVVGPLLTGLSLSAYFASTETWRYLSGAVLLIRYSLPGVFTENAYPSIVNGSLWTLPVEFFCYATVMVMGLFLLRVPRWSRVCVVLAIVVAMLASWLGPLWLGERLTTHFEMVACFWWGVGYAVWVRLPRDSEQKSMLWWGGLLLVASVAIGPRGGERTAMLLLAAALVGVAMHTDRGRFVTEKLGDISYGMYIFAFPVQQLVVLWGQHRGWTFAQHFCLSLVLTGFLAYASWHWLEKQVLRFKPARGKPSYSGAASG